MFATIGTIPITTILIKLVQVSDCDFIYTVKLIVVVILFRRHHAPTSEILTGSANIDRATKASPTSSSMLNEKDKKLHSDDHAMAEKCIERLNVFGTQKTSDSNNCGFCNVLVFYLTHVHHLIQMKLG